MSTETSSENDLDCQPLLALARPQLYRRNLFRILGLAFDATSRDVQRKQQRMQMQRKLGVASSAQDAGPFSLEPPADEQEVRSAIERLNRPTDRLLDEVFWFWPLATEGADPALQALQNGDVKAACAEWERHPKNARALHNLAVHAHLDVLDRETAGASPPAVSSSWKAVLGKWRLAMLEAEGLTSALKDRVKQLNDSVLTTGFARRIVETLPSAILLINARLACAAAERGAVADARQHVALLKNANLGRTPEASERLVEEALKEAIQPCRDRIKAAIGSSKSRWEEVPQNGARFVRELAAQARNLLNVVDAVLPEAAPARSAMHDLVCDAMLDGQLAYGKKTDDWTGCIALLQLALDLQPGEALKARLLENIEVLKSNAKSGGDWVSAGYWDLPPEATAQMESAREKIRAGNPQGAIALLSTLDPKLGGPLRRCLAFSLRNRGIQLFNSGLEEYNQPTEILLQTLIKFGGGGSLGSGSSLFALLHGMQRPNPNSSFNPPCPGCGCSGGQYGGYTRWFNFTYRGVSMWWCDGCNDREARQIEAQKRTFRPIVSEALEHLQLAQEIDPKESQIQEDLKSFKEVAGKIGASIPGSKGLREKLGSSSTLPVLLASPGGDTGGSCFFCSTKAGDASLAVIVPMCGNVTRNPQFFGEGCQFQFTDIFVPRCSACAREHRFLPTRVQLWQEARAKLQRDDAHPKEDKANREAQARRKSAQSAREAAAAKKAARDAELKTASQAGSQCDPCGEKRLPSGMCVKCDKKILSLSGLAKFSLFLLCISLPSMLILNAYGPVSLNVTLVGWILSKHWKKRKAGIEIRAAALQALRAEGIRIAKANLAEAADALMAAEQKEREAEQQVGQAAAAMEFAKKTAMLRFDRENPKPTLNGNVLGQESFAEYRMIADFRARGWHFGHTLDTKTRTGAKEPVGVRGLLSPVSKTDAEFKKQCAALPGAAG